MADRPATQVLVPGENAGTIVDQRPSVNDEFVPGALPTLWVANGTPAAQPEPTPPAPPPPPQPPHSADVAAAGVADAGAHSVNAGDDDTFEFVISNRGPDGTKFAVKIDSKNFGISDVSGACGSIHCVVGLRSGVEQRLTMTGQVGQPGEYGVQVDARNDDDPDRSNNRASILRRAVVAISSDVVVEPKDNGGSAAPGQDDVFDFEVSNLGPDPATLNVTFDRTNFETANVEGCATADCVIDLASQEAKLLHVRGRVLQEGRYGVVVVAHAEHDGNASNNSARIERIAIETAVATSAAAPTSAQAPSTAEAPTASTVPSPATTPTATTVPSPATASTSTPRSVPEALNLMTRPMSATAVRPGETVVYQIEIENVSESAATDVVLEFSYAINFVDISLSGEGCQSFPCRLGTIQSHQKRVLTLSALVPDYGDYRADLPLQWSGGGGRGRQGLTAFVLDRTRLPLWVWYVLCGGIAGLVAWKIIPRLIHSPGGKTPPGGKPAWLPRLHVAADMPEADADPVGDIPLRAPAFSVSALPAEIDADAPGEVVVETIEET